MLDTCEIRCYGVVKITACLLNFKSAAFAQRLNFCIRFEGFTWITFKLDGLHGYERIWRDW